jgi:protease-4
MKKFLLGFLAGLLFVGFTILILIVAAIRFGGPKKPMVADNSMLVLHLEDSLPEQAPVEFNLDFLDRQQPMTVAETWKVLRNAAADSRIKGVLLEPRGLSVGWAKLEELRAQIANFKKSGKPVYAYLRGGGTREYYIASVADRIYMSPEDELDVKGLRAELTYFKGTLDKVGVQMEFEHVGKYKDAPDMFTKTGPSGETLEVTNLVLDQFYNDFANVVAEGRKKSASDVKAVIDRGPFVGKEALTAGLVDSLNYEEEVVSQLKEKLKIGDDHISERDYARTDAPAGVEGPNRIALLVGQGDITRGATNQGPSNDGITASGMIRLIRQVRDDASIKAVILRVDSPGGDGIASDDILHEAKLLSQKKPTVISMSDLAASGGYFISMTGDPVIAYRNTETGSIGVFFGKANLRPLYDKLGIRKTILKRGQFADIDTTYSALDDKQRAKLRTEIEEFYKGFVQRVADSRKRKYDEVEPLAQGRVWTGAQAKQNGLVDEIGGLDRAIELAKQKAKLSPSYRITLVPYPPRRSLWELLIERGSDTISFDSLISAIEERWIGSHVGPALKEVLGEMPARSLSEGGILRLMPYSIRVE